MKPVENEAETALESLATEALGYYGLGCDSLTLTPIQSGGPKALWKVASGKNTYVLKKFRHAPAKVAFTTAAQRYAHRMGARVPAVIRSRAGGDYVMAGGQVFALYEFIHGRPVSWSNPAQFRRGVEALAEFHVRSRGYAPPPGCQVSSKLGRWPHQYRSIIDRSREWSVAARGSTEQFCRLFEQNSGWAVALAEFASRLLERFDYTGWVREFEKRPGICHQDYGEGNCIDRGGDIYILDLDGVTFDIPARDIRKVVVKTTAGCGRWDQDHADEVFSWFQRVNPLRPAQEAVAFADILFPHTFHDVAKNRFLKGKPTSSGKLAEAIGLELAKASSLKTVFRERFGVPAAEWPSLP
ncbi:MAG: CotS family spore coat protein [Firmicutes bacterium]|nr:CotS family spore coat protein [Bacillota bacterium]